MLRRAKGLVIVNQVQVSFLLGVKDGWGVAMVKKPSGQWSLPVFIKASELSLGLQAGGKSIETIYVLMDDAAARLLFRTRFKFGLDAKAVAGPHAAEAERSTPEFDAQVLVYSNVSGFYAGATVKTGTIAPLVEATQQFYQTRLRHSRDPLQRLGAAAARGAGTHELRAAAQPVNRVRRCFRLPAPGGDARGRFVLEPRFRVRRRPRAVDPSDDGTGKSAFRSRAAA